MTKLTEAEITEALRDLPGWERQGQQLRRTFDRASFNGAIAFVGTLSELAERADHHPDIDIRYAKVTVMLTTHDAGGLTKADVTLARQIQAAAD
jgi:4a-hydroxytetrahydrobiopterin dehydratase